MPSPDQLVHLAHHHHRIAVMIAIASSQLGMWICIWIAVFANRKKVEDPDQAERGYFGRILRKKSSAPQTSFSVRGREDGPQQSG